MGSPFGPHQARRQERLSLPTKRAALISPGDVIGYDGEWRTVKEASTAQGPMGGLAVVVTWEEGGTARFPAGDELLLGKPDSV
ncbi:hypothetical protein ADL28_25265 [Streptomyces violaceusniger]|uniref:DUF1918 domain-containing protein n=2 Tax=Streptomyces violaceusniger group TaxID=2839105 RepID=A0ABD5J0R3_9ACTN|nr:MULTISPECIES: hypothetical protein [Streptomyces]MEE4581806.1 hypothetical protein [Streptomyces sp. DSM 41602]KUL50584.1 hypothetical protein ADL28_25265 [Streptomyces violaceusniger]QTI89947.1 hypothetical protein AS97_56830 [Streptomyces sp. AgN23]RSS47444.1 hypothetical protein EF902_09415 [Streptomyces sp. WAC05858]WTA85655.1 hypothetical protein OG751_40590 [Streptomyces antimycoticus]